MARKQLAKAKRRVAVENGGTFVREYLEFTRRWKSALISLEGEQRTRPASERQADTGSGLP
jgi:hypothetical protein